MKTTHLYKALRKYITWIIISSLCLIIIGIIIIYPTTNTNYRTALLEEMETTNNFNSFSEALFCYDVTCDSITTAYTLENPDAYNIPSLTPTLTSFSYSGYEKNNRAEDNLYQLLNNSLSRFDTSHLSASQQVTYELITKTIDLNSKLNDYPYYPELLGSSTGVQANLPVTLGEYPLNDETDIKVYLDLLSQVPTYFEDVIKYETKRKELGITKQDYTHAKNLGTLKTLLEGFENEDNSFIDTFNNRIDEVSSLSEKEKNRYKKKNLKYVNTYIIPAYEKLYEYLYSTTSPIKENELPDMDATTPYGLSTLPQGKDYYTLLIKQSTGSNKSPKELITLTENTLSNTLGTTLNIAITEPDTYKYYCENELETCYQSPNAIVDSLALMTREDYPALSKIPEYEIKNVSESLAPSLSPAFYMIPAIDNYEENIIYINPLYTNEGNGNLYTTLAHEGFPGHLYQTVYFNKSNPNPLRQILNYPGYVEGWATYVELNSLKYLDFPDKMNNLCTLYKNETILSLAISSRIDLGVNYENWTLNDVKKFFEDNGFNSYYAENIYSYVTEAPANYLSYFIGYLEIQQLKEEYKNLTMENYSEKEFHEKVLEIGPCDFETLRSYILDEKGYK